MKNFTVNAAAPTFELPHYWEKCVGSCHAYTALREDYRSQLRKAHEEAGFQYVRFHGLLDDDMSVVFRSRDGKLIYNFFNIDSICDFLLSIGMKPFLELGFMPGVLASTNTTCFHYKGNVSKPKDYNQWDTLIEKLASHLVERYGINEVSNWYFEVWNEPNLKFFYEGTQDDYFELYEHTARAIKKVNPALRVGGPATACNGWIADLIHFCEANSVPLDFVSTHHYPTDDPLWESGMSLDEAIQKFMKNNKDDASEKKIYYKRGILTEMIHTAKKEAGNYPLYYTEWNSSAQLPDEVHDLPYSSSLVAKTVIDNIGLVEAYSFWTFTDIFEENGQLPGEFHGGFGLQTVHGIPKPTYRVFQLLHMLGDQQLPRIEEQGSVGMIATTQENDLRILAYNHNVLGEEIETEHVHLTIQNREVSGAEIIYVDETHGNAYAEWKRMGSPEYPNSDQMEALKQASEIKPMPLKVDKTTDGAVIDFDLVPYAVAYLRIY